MGAPILEGGSGMASGRNYTIRLRTGKDGAQYLLIREVPPARSRPARQWVSAVAERLTMLKPASRKRPGSPAGVPNGAPETER